MLDRKADKEKEKQKEITEEQESYLKKVTNTAQ